MTGAHTNTLASLHGTSPSFTQQFGIMLLCVSGPDAGKNVVVTQDTVTIGSDASCDLVLSDLTVSREHAKASPGRRCIELLDCGSKNGTFKANERIEAGKVLFGREFRVGKTSIRVLPAEETLDPTPSPNPRIGSVVGDAPVMRKLFTLIDKAAQASISVLLEGETGTGKELIADEIHRRSPRKDKPFVIFDCGAVPDHLLESTLFGHVKGAFTGADRDRPGIFEVANGGTVFLDEIGELQLELQPALLRVLDRGMVRRVGSTEYREVDVRIVAATHRNLGRLISAGRFREDLYYRLAAIRLAIPPLRDRLEDLGLLVSAFLTRLGRPDLELDAASLRLLREHHWPGNCRELKNVVERTVALSPAGTFSIQEAEALGANFNVERGPRLSRGQQSFKDAKLQAVEQFERDFLENLLATHGSLTAAAKAATMDRKHLRTLLRRYGLWSQSSDD